ncbi:GATA type zinc finger transcription factor family protein [Actinidia rufa]|uniref:GATA type zinc finger transcription factor family protein n=1 Tax=Actinidia rufa TaxID=165716 RepID=A0A7J0F1P8_9ERIC|nr:GATA type zinc finger transcription factor family protein [Actinidia rufa]
MAFTGTLDKCKACDKTVYFVDLLSADGITYHKSCFKCSHCKGTLVTRAPSKLSSLFSGTQDKCPACNKTVYPLEKVIMEGESFHKSCFKCAHGGCPLTHSSYAALDGILYCKHHFAQLFMEKGNYNHVLKAATHKKSAVAPVEEEGKIETKQDEEPEEQTQEQS